MDSFQKILSDTDVKKQMAVNCNFMHHLPASSGGVQVRDARSGNMYEFAYYVRGDGHPKPVFQGGWRDYCRDKGLQAGDRITFSIDGGSFTILAERKLTRLFGNNLWNPVE